MCVGIVGIEDYHVAVFVHLVLTHFVLVLIERSILAVKVLIECKCSGFLIELLVCQHTKLDEHLDVVPFLGKLVLVRFVQFREFICHFLGDVTADFLDVIVGLQITTADIQRDIRTVNDTVQQGQILGDDVLHFVGHIDLIAVELNLIAVHVEVGLDFREIEDTGEVERIVHIQMNMEERFFELSRIEFVVELIIVLISQVGRFACPSRVNIINDILFIKFDLFAVFPFFLLAESDLYRQELTVFLKQAFDGRVLEVLRELIVDMQNNIGTTLRLDGVLHRIFRVAFARPVNSLRVLFVRERENLHFLGNHEGRIETETEMADDGFCLVFVLVEELLCAGERDLVDELIHLFGRHSDTVVGDGKCLFLFINRNAYARITQVTLDFAYGRKGLEFGRCINCVGNQLTKKNLVVGIQKFLDDGENIVTRHSNVTFTHIINNK